MTSSNIIPLIGNIKYEISLRNNEDVIQAIQIRERDIAAGIESADAPWFVVSSISWVPELLDSEKIKKAIGNAFTTTETPWYLLNVLKSNSHLLLSKHVLKGIAVALEASANFWLFIDHMKTIEPLVKHSDIKKSINKRAKLISSEICESSNPITFIQSIKNFPEVFKDDSIQSAILHVVLEHETPWKILHELTDIETIANIQNNPQVLDLMEKKGREVAEQIENTLNFPFGDLSVAVKIPELARTTAIRSLLCKMMATSNYDDDSSYVGLLCSSDYLASHPECQETASRILIASECPWSIVEDLISVAERYDIWKKKYFLNSVPFSNALSYRIDDIIEAVRLLKDNTIDFRSRRDLMLILDTVPDLANAPAIDENLAESILKSENPTSLICDILEYTSRGKKQKIQRAIAIAIRQNEHLMEIIQSLEKEDFLLEVKEIQEAIRFRSESITIAIEQGESISFKSKLTSIIDQENLVNAFIKRLGEAKRPDEVIGQIFKSRSLAKNKALHKEIAKTIRTSEKPFLIIEALCNNSTPFGERWRALMDSEVMESIAYQIKTTKTPSHILQKIGWNEYAQLFFTNRSIMKALNERLDDFVAIAVDSNGFYYNLRAINQIRSLYSNDKIINAIVNAIRNPRHFRGIMQELSIAMQKRKEVLQSLEDASDILLRLLDTEEATLIILHDAFHPVMLRNKDVVNWFIKNIDKLSDISPIIINEFLEIPGLEKEILRIIRTAKAPANIYFIRQLLHLGYLEKNPAYRNEIERIIETILLESTEPWNFELDWIYKYVDTQKIRDITKKLIPDILSAIRSSNNDKIDLIIIRVSQVPLWYSNDKIVQAIAIRIKDLQWRGLLYVSHNEILASNKSIQQEVIQLIKETPKVIEKLMAINSEVFYSHPELRNTVLSRISDIIDEFMASEHIDDTLRVLGQYQYIIQTPQFKNALRKRMDEVISLIARWPIDQIHITIGTFQYFDEILNEPTVYNLILMSIQESHNPWEIIGEIKKNESLMNNDEIRQAIQSRTEYIARSIASVNNPSRIYRDIEGVEEITQHPLVKKIVAEMNSES